MRKQADESAAPAERTKESAALRQEMHKLEQDIAKNNDEIGDVSSDKLRTYILRSNEQANRLQRAADQVTSTSTFRRLVQAGSDSVTKFVRNAGTTTPLDLARRMTTKFATDAEPVDVDREDVPLSAFNWHALGVDACEVYKTTSCASMDCMLGAIAPPKVRVKKQAQKRKAAVEAEKAPDQVDTSKQSNENETARLAEAMYACVERHHCAPYAFFVLDHASFAQTVENMFSIAVLVGTARVALRADAEWGMQVQLTKGFYQGQPVPPQPKGDAAQMVLNMNYQMWEALKGQVEPAQCLAKHRSAIGGAAASQRSAGAGKENQQQRKQQRAEDTAAQAGSSKKQRKAKQ